MAVGIDGGECRWLRASRRRSRAPRRVGAALLRLGAGVALATLVPGLALAPVGRAIASVELHLAPPPAFGPLAVAVEPSGAFQLGGNLRAEGGPTIRFGTREVPRELVGSVSRAAHATGVDPTYLLALAETESSFRPDVKAPTSSAEGLFQFIDRTWLEVVSRFGTEHGLDMEADAITVGPGDRPVVEDEAMRARILELRREPYVAAVMAAEMLKRDAAEIGGRTGRALSTTDLYLAHFLGREEASRFLGLLGAKRPASAAAAFPAAARANAGIFFERRKRGRRGLSVDEVYGKLGRLIDGRVLRFRDAPTVTAAAGS